MLQSNTVSHWLGANLETAVQYTWSPEKSYPYSITMFIVVEMDWQFSDWEDMFWMRKCKPCIFCALQNSSYPPFREVWRRAQQNPEEYMTFAQKVADKIILEEIPGVLFADATYLAYRAQTSGLCNADLLDTRFLPLGFGIAFGQDSPYKPFIDAVWVFLCVALPRAISMKY